MENHFKLSDEAFEKQFSEYMLDPSIFSHEAHLRLAWIHLDKYGLEQAKDNIQKQLQNFVAHVGATGKYHTTLTIVAIQAVDHFMKQSKSRDFVSFIKEFPQLKERFKELVASHYSFDVFNSPEARIEFLAPDVVPFD